MGNLLRQRSVIDFYAQLGETSATEIQQKLREAHGDAITLCAVYKRIQRLKDGNRRIHDEPRPGRPMVCPRFEPRDDPIEEGAGCEATVHKFLPCLPLSPVLNVAKFLRNQSSTDVAVSQLMDD